MHTVPLLAAVFKIFAAISIYKGIFYLYNILTVIKYRMDTMQRSFPETLSALRRDKNISQRKAAADLNISQALLSHYENGAREPGLGFVCRACDYYGVSADYLLCRTDRPNIAFSTAQTARAFLDQMQSVIDRANQTLAEFSEEERPE